MIRLGVIGYGSRIHGMIDHNFRKIAPDLRVVGILDPDEQGVRTRLADCDRDARFYKDLATMVRHAKLDALAIGTRCNLHSRYAVQAARYDLPLFLLTHQQITNHHNDEHNHTHYHAAYHALDQL